MKLFYLVVVIMISRIIECIKVRSWNQKKAEHIKNSSINQKYNYKKDFDEKWKKWTLLEKGWYNTEYLVD